jgi:hypothetical protein
VESEDLWRDALPAWVPLEDLLRLIERELGVAAERARSPVLQALHRHEIDAVLVDPGRQLTEDTIGLGAWTYRTMILSAPSDVGVSSKGWDMVDLRHGTLGGYVVKVCWAQVSEVVDPLRDKPSAELEKQVVVGRGAGGKPLQHDWDGFWIEVALYADKNDLDAAHRNELQKHLEEWSASEMRDPAPTPATIRTKLSRLYKAAASAKDTGGPGASTVTRG